MYNNFEENVLKMIKLRDRLVNGILETIDHTVLNGPLGERPSPTIHLHPLH